MGDTLRFRCDVGWENMTPLPDGRRHCARCDKPVHDLTRFTRRQAEAFRRENPSACVHVVARADTYELVFGSEPRRRLPLREAAVAAALALGCSSESASVEAPAVEAPAIDAPAIDAPSAPAPTSQARTPETSASMMMPLEPSVGLPIEVAEDPPEAPASAAPSSETEVPAPRHHRRSRRPHASSRADAGVPSPPSLSGYQIIDGGW